MKERSVHHAEIATIADQVRAEALSGSGNCAGNSRENEHVLTQATSFWVPKPDTCRALVRICIR
jgi:hypothetical protein